MQNLECIVFERTRDTEQRIHEQCACLWVPCSSRLQPVVAWNHLHHTRMVTAFARWNFLLPVAKKNNNAATFNVSLKQNNSRQQKKRKEKYKWESKLTSCFNNQGCYFLRLHRRTINSFSFKNTQSINLYVQYSRILIWFFENYKLAYKTAKFLRILFDKNTNFIISGFQILYAVEQFSLLLLR